MAGKKVDCLRRSLRQAHLGQRDLGTFFHSLPDDLHSKVRVIRNDGVKQCEQALRGILIPEGDLHDEGGLIGLCHRQGLHHAKASREFSHRHATHLRRPVSVAGGPLERHPVSLDATRRFATDHHHPAGNKARRAVLRVNREQLRRRAAGTMHEPNE
jgi:hypothetical protein